MGGCLSRRKRNNNVAQENSHIDEVVLEEFNRRYNALILEENKSAEIIVNYHESPDMNLLKRRLRNLQKSLEDDLNENTESEQELKIDTEALESRLRALGSGLAIGKTGDIQTLTKKEIAKLKIAEEKIIEYEIRLAKLQKPLIINGEVKI